MKVSVLIPTHNPRPEYLRRTLTALRAQALAANHWECLIIDNASTSPLDIQAYGDIAPAGTRVLNEPRLGLTAARRRGLSEAAGEFAVFVDDDNLLAPDYLAAALDTFGRLPKVGAVGGRSIGEFETAPSEWHQEFLSLLAVRDLGPAEKISQGLRPAGSRHNCYPLFAPVGAGMALRREAWLTWLHSDATRTISDRRGSDLTSSGDNDIILTLMSSGWEVAYCPKLALKHIIPTTRLNAGYLARLNRGIQQSWMQVLSAHDANPWGKLTRSGATVRKAKAWFAYRAWSSAPAKIRWQGACGHFDGRVG
jgi:glycosyltransferase involved in cell wall biosynthesis